CPGAKLTQESDVLDTWFSSALWPFSTMGWPQQTEELAYFYPTTVLVTAFDIIFFWVARMIMMGLKFMDDVPFRDVYIHALIRDEQGAKMSKSKGNVIDPLIMMEQYGTDALRFTLCMLAAQGRDIILSEKRIEGYRTFCNKIWNATRFILMNLGDDFREREPDAAGLETFDRWILHRLNEAIRATDAALAEYKFNDAAHAIYSFWWHEFCDWYIELTKQRLYDREPGSAKSSDTARQVLFHVLKESIRLLHPFMPFITEELWEKIKGEKDGLIMVSRWPRPRPELDFAAESAETALFQEIVYRIRNVRGEMNVPPDRKAPVVFKTSNGKIAEVIKREEVHIRALARVESITVDAGYAPANTDASAVMTDLEIFVPLANLIDFGKERARIDKEIEKMKADLARVEQKLSNESFIGKAPADVIDREKAKRDEMAGILAKLETSRAKLG
ncbi:MAG TPA: class I tRNA ligase family protein, partial [Rectinemataceae bacterium]|nr:class I tRNA ligase family protein [Rectinemataceae bacterium]